jgi:hypothetical protein
MGLQNITASYMAELEQSLNYRNNPKCISESPVSIRSILSCDVKITYLRFTTIDQVQEYWKQ